MYLSCFIVNRVFTDPLKLVVQPDSLAILLWNLDHCTVLWTRPRKNWNSLQDSRFTQTTSSVSLPHWICSPLYRKF